MEIQTPQEEELDLLDLILTLVESWKLLLLGPLVAGLLVYGISCVIPKTYQSQSSIQVERPGSTFTAPVAASLALSADVLRQIAPVAGLDEGLSAEEIYKKLSKRITVSVGKQDKLLTISTQAHTPANAQKLNQALLDTLFPFSKPRGTEKAQLERQLATETKRLQDSTQLEQETSANLASGKSVSEATSRLYGELLAANSKRQESILEMQRRLDGLDRDDIVQSPTTPEESIKPKKALLTIGAAVAAAFALLLFVFARQSIRAAKESSPEQAEKLARIRKALPW